MDSCTPMHRRRRQTPSRPARRRRSGGSDPPTTCGIPSIAAGPVSNPSTPTPRRIVTPRAFWAAFANTHSPRGRRAVNVQSLSSIGRGARSVKNGGSGLRRSNRLAPARPSASGTSGSSASSNSRRPGMKLCGWRNCATPLRSQCSQAASADGGIGSASRSRTVTSCPSRASRRAVPSPQMPPPMIRMRIGRWPPRGSGRSNYTDAAKGGDELRVVPDLNTRRSLPGPRRMRH
jgi:hypothetical protein